MIPQFSLRFAVIALAYLAVLCFAYVTPNVWVGWLAVIATAALIANSILNAFRNQNQMTLGFAIASSTMLITCLGFAIETRGLSAWDFGEDLRGSIHRFLRIRPVEVLKIKDQKPSVDEIRTVHHITYAIGLGKNQSKAEQINLFRVVICISSLLIGCFGGLTFKLFNIPRQKKPEPI